MMSFLRHSLKLTVANFLGLLMYMIIVFAVTMIFYLFSILIVFGAIGLDKVSGDALFQYDFLTPVVMIILIIIYLIFLLCICAAQSIYIGGLYGSTIQSVFENRSSIGSYFQHSFRHIFRLTGFQLAIILLMLPLFLMIAAGQFLFDKFVGQDFHFLFVIFSIILLLLSYTLFLHTPIFIIRYRMKIWRSIGLSFRLFFKKPFRVFFSGLLFFGTTLLIHILFALLIFVPAALGGYVLNMLIDFDIFTVIQGIFAFLVIIFWICFISPYSFVSASLVLVHHYQKHLHPYVDPDEDQFLYGHEPEGPIFQYK